MPLAAKLRILLVEPMGHCIGHFSYYVRRLAESLLDAGQADYVTVVGYAGWRDEWPQRTGLSLVQARPDSMKVDWAPVERSDEWDRATAATLRVALPLGHQHDVVHLIDCSKPAVCRALPRHPELAGKIVMLEHHVPVAYYLREVPPFPRGIRTRWRHHRTVKLDRWLAGHTVLHVHAEAVAEAVRTVTPEARVVIIPPGSDPPAGTLPEAGEARQALGPDPGRRKALLLFGFIGPHKGLHVLLEALRDTDLPLHLLIAGPPSEGYPVAEMVREAGWEAHTTLRLGYVPDDEVALWFRAADAIMLIYPRSFVQNSGVLTRAADFGTPAIVADVGQIAALTRQYGVGLLFEPESAPSLREALERFVGLTEEETAAMQRGLQQLAADHSWPRVAERHLEMYRQVVAKGDQP